MPVSRHVRATFPADPASAAAAGRFVRHAMANWRAADARLVAGWAKLSAAAIADRIHAAVDEFAAEPPHDGVAVLVLAARPRPGSEAGPPG